MSCQCEVYEICAQCAPSQEAFLRAVRDHDEAVNCQSPSSSPSYTLADLEALMREWLQVPNGPVDYSPASTMSTFLAWLGRKEREANEQVG